MKQTLLVKLAPTPDQHDALLRTLEAFNATCNAIAAVAFRERMASKIDLQKLVYYDVRRDFGLAAQMAIRAIAKVSAGFYTSDLWTRQRNDNRWPRIQIRTVEQLLESNGFEVPPRPVQFKQVGRVSQAAEAQALDLWSMADSTEVDEVDYEGDDL